MNLNLGISVFTSVICFLSISCKKDNRHLDKTNLDKQCNCENLVERKYPVVAYAYDIESDSVPDFSIVALNLSSDFFD